MHLSRQNSQKHACHYDETLFASDLQHLWISICQDTHTSIDLFDMVGEIFERGNHCYAPKIIVLDET